MLHLAVFFAAWWEWFFAGVFEKTGCLDVVNLWCECGVSRGGCGVLDVTFWGSKKVPGF
jgi:hypothetical protein